MADSVRFRSRNFSLRDKTNRAEESRAITDRAVTSSLLALSERARIVGNFQTAVRNYLFAVSRRTSAECVDHNSADPLIRVVLMARYSRAYPSIIRKRRKHSFELIK